MTQEEISEQQLHLQSLHQDVSASTSQLAYLHVRSSTSKLTLQFWRFYAGWSDAYSRIPPTATARRVCVSPRSPWNRSANYFVQPFLPFFFDIVDWLISGHSCHAAVWLQCSAVSSYRWGRESKKPTPRFTGDVHERICIWQWIMIGSFLMFRKRSARINFSCKVCSKMLQMQCRLSLLIS